MHLLLLLPLFCIPRCSTAKDPITGPNEVTGLEGDSLTVQCPYASSWKTYKKYWCRGAAWGSCQTMISTDKSEQEVKKDRVSIRDDQETFVLTVTMEDLRRDDADTYWCVIERTGADHKAEVKVIVDPAPATVSTMVPTTSTSTTNASTASVTTEDTNVLPTPNGRHSIMELSILLPLVAVLLLLLVAASLLAWRMMRRQKKAAGPSPEQVLQPLEDDLCYANLSLQQPGTSPGSLARAHPEEVDYVTMAPFPRGDISYASLSLDTVDQEPTYSNTGHLVTHLASVGHEAPTEYSSIRRP